MSKFARLAWKVHVKGKSDFTHAPRQNTRAPRACQLNAAPLRAHFDRRKIGKIHTKTWTPELQMRCSQSTFKYFFLLQSRVILTQHMALLNPRCTVCDHKINYDVFLSFDNLLAETIYFTCARRLGDATQSRHRSRVSVPRDTVFASSFNPCAASCCATTSPRLASKL